MYPVQVASSAELDAPTLYRLLALRSEVFVVEQRAAYLDPDGRDLEPSARQLWVADEHGRVLSTLRLLREPDGCARIGRVATAAPARGCGYAAALLQRALQLAGGHDVVLDAQVYLREWYERFGFVVSGAQYTDPDAIAHVPMRRQPPMSPRRQPPMSPRRQPPVSPPRGRTP